MNPIRVLRAGAVFLMVVMAAMAAMAPSAHAAVTVYAEGAYTETDLVLFVYADITNPAILSSGVKVTYNTADLTVTSAEKNDAVWYMGTPAAKIPYMAPETGTPGEVVIINGKLDTAAPTAGVSGTRVLVGKIVFTRTGSGMPFAPVINIDYGRGGDYDNFVAVDGAVQDSVAVSFTTVTIRRRGDANGNGTINSQDIAAVKYYMTNGGPNNPWKDCNANGVINSQDIACIKYKMTH